MIRYVCLYVCLGFFLVFFSNMDLNPPPERSSPDQHQHHHHAQHQARDSRSPVSPMATATMVIAQAQVHQHQHHQQQQQQQLQQQQQQQQQQQHNVGGPGVGVNKRYRPAPAKTFQCRGYGDCRMVFSRSEHLARHIRFVPFLVVCSACDGLKKTRHAENTQANVHSHAIAANNSRASIICANMLRRSMRTSKSRMSA